MALCQWDFQHLEVIGTKCSCPPEWDEIRGRIPQLKVETRKRIDVRKESPTAEPRIPARSSSAKQLLHVKPPKEKVVTVKVVLPKKKPEVIERNYLCTCDEERSVQSLKDGVGVVEEIEFNELMKVFLKYGEGPRKQSSKTLRNIARGFQGSRILSSDEALQVCTMRSRRDSSPGGFYNLFAHHYYLSLSDICLLKCQLDLIIVPVHNSKVDKYFLKLQVNHYTHDIDRSRAP